MSASLPVRLIRAAVVAGVALVLGAGAHQLGSGLLPGPRVLGGVALVLVTVGVVVLREQASLLRVGVLVVGGQGLVHLVLSSTAGHTEPLAIAGTGAPAQGRLDAALLHLVAHLAEVSPAMALAHVGVAGLVAGWLWHGERTLWTLMRGLLTAVRHRWATWSLTGILAADGPLPRRGVPAAAADRVGVRMRHLHGAWSHRGPPVVGGTLV
ncbi:MAG: hypothetical protein Q8Q02_00310 [Nocardioides sp.]|nr:hypothetical protein [Nocardioides sp.]